MSKLLLLIACLLWSTVARLQEDLIETVLQKGHSAQISCSDFGPDKRLLVTGSYDHGLILWDAVSRKQIRTFGWHTGPVRSVNFTKDGSKILSCSSEGAYLTNVKTGELVHRYTLNEESINQAFLSPDEKHVLVTDSRSQVFVFDLESEDIISKQKKDYDARISPYIVSPNGDRILNASSGKLIEVKSLDSNKTIVELEFDKCHNMMFSPDGRYIALSSRKLFSGIFDAETGKKLHHLEANSEAVCDGCNTKIGFSKDGKFLVSAAHKSGAALWDVKKGKKLWLYDIPKDRVKSVGFSSNNQYVVIQTASGFIVLNAKSGAKVLQKNTKNLTRFDVGVSSNGPFVAVPHKYNSLAILNLNTAKLAYHLKGFNNIPESAPKSDIMKDVMRFIRPKTKVTLSPDGKYLAITQTDSSVLIRDLHTGKPVKRLSGHKNLVLDAIFSSDGKRLATAGFGSRIFIWNTADWSLTKTIKTTSGIVFDLDFNSDNTEILSTGWDGVMSRWNVATAKRLISVDVGPSSGYVAAYSPGDLYLAGANVSGKLHLYEADAGESFRPIIGHTKLIVDLEFSPDGQSFATASRDGKVKLWDLTSGMLKAKISSQQGGFNAVAFAPQEDMIAIGGDQRTIGLYTKTGKHLANLNGHSSSVSSLQFSNDGRYLVSCTIDNEIKVWDMRNRTELYTYIQISRNQWLSRHTSGHFDGSEKALKAVNYVSGTKAISVGSLFKKYYTPGLIKEVMSGKSFKMTGDNIEKMIDEKPNPELLIKGQAVALDSVLLAREEKVKVQLSIPNGAENDVVRIYNNGKLISEDDMSSTLKFRGGEGVIKDFELELNNGLNDISFVVVNEKGLESEPQFVHFNMDGDAGKTDLFILTIGINDYKNPNYQLNYAISDASAFGKTVKNDADRLFNKVYDYTIKNDKAIKANINTTIDEIAAKIGPEDVFIMYYAGHGVLNSQEDFYIVTYDITNFYGNDDALAEKAISASELSQMAMKISAQKQVYVLDACHSGGALKQLAQRGAGREKALAQLARSTGTFYLTASQDYQFANEAGDLKHGLFTYAILEALKGEVETISQDKKLTISELRTYVEERVPELSESYHGKAQYPTSYSFGQDFPIKALE